MLLMYRQRFRSNLEKREDVATFAAEAHGQAREIVRLILRGHDLDWSPIFAYGDWEPSGDVILLGGYTQNGGRSATRPKIPKEKKATSNAAERRLAYLKSMRGK